MIGVDDAIKKVLNVAIPLDADEMQSVNAVGFILAEDIISDTDVPPFDRSTMDGYAMKASSVDAGVEIPVDALVGAGDCYPDTVPDGHAVKIMTGAPIPDGCDTVIPIEEISEIYEVVIKLDSNPKKGRNIALKGEEIAKGNRVLRKGTSIDAIISAVLAQVGFTKVIVHRRPNILILVTGSELVEPDHVPTGGQIRESNSYGLLAQCSIWGGVGLRTGSSVDSYKDLERELRAIFKLAPDILLITGGVSVGDFDLVPDVLSGLEAEIVFHNVAQKPAKPMLFARHDKTLVFGLPGNPVAAFLGFELYVGPAIRRVCGDIEYKTRFMTAIASDDFKVSSDRELFHPARIYFKDDEWIAEPVSARGSADICSIVNANAFARFEKGKYTVSKGERVKFFFLRGKSYGT